MGLAAVAAVVLAALAHPHDQRASPVPGSLLPLVITGLVLNSVVGVSSSVISVLGVAVVLFVISRWREGRTAAVWGLPPLFLLWANMDAGFAAGLVIALAALLVLPVHSGVQREPASTRHRAGCQRCRGARQPCRARHLRLVLSGVFNPGVAQSLAAYGSPNFHEWWARLFEGEVVLVIVFWTISGGPDRFSAITGFGLVIATLFAQENLGLFAVFMAPQLAVHGSRAWTLHVAPRIARDPRTATRRLHPVATSALVLALAAAVG